MGRKRELELEVLRLQLQLDQATMNLERVREERGQFVEKANTLEWSLRAANDQAKDLHDQLHKLAIDKAVLMERLELVAAGIAQNTPTTDPNNVRPLPTGHEPEEIEDARYALSAGRINHSEFQTILENYGFSNTEVHVDGIPGGPTF
jgi:chromosome segregation ATPase